jgi:D-amino peptidase
VSDPRRPYEEAVAQLGRELNVVIEAALAAGAQEIVVNDSHAAMTNLTLEHVGRKGPVRLLSGKPKPCAMSAGLDDSFDGVLLIGYHAMAGTQNGVLCHTFHDGLFEVRINGIPVGESAVNALYASLCHRVPVLLASGDAALCDEIGRLHPGIRTVETKQGLSFSAALCHPEETVFARYREAISQLFSNRPLWENTLLQWAPPYRLEMTFLDTVRADVVATQMGLQRLDGRTLAFTSEAFESLYRTLQTSYSLLAYVHTFS